MLVLPNLTIEPSNVRKKKESLNVIKVQSHMILILHNLKMVLSNVRKKNRSTTKYGKSTIKCDVNTV